MIIITGQTATGKTNYALQLAKENNGELINCDSRQIYRHLDIITGKDIEKGSDFHLWEKLNNFELGFYTIQDIPIWLYDIVDPRHHFSSFDYQTCTTEVIRDIVARGKTPIIVGGTYFYLKHLLYDIDTQAEPDWELRKELDAKTVEELQEMLRNLNAEMLEEMNNSDRNNPRRLMRRIEIAKEQKEMPIPLRSERPIKRFTAFSHSTKESLTKAITDRVEKRLSEGALEEVERLLAQGYSKTDPGLQTIGYQQLIDYLEGITSLDEAKQIWITREVQYAKRQLTFMKKDTNIALEIARSS